MRDLGERSGFIELAKAGKIGTTSRKISNQKYGGKRGKSHEFHIKSTESKCFLDMKVQ